MKGIIRCEGWEAHKKRSLARAKKIDAGERLAPELSRNFENLEDLTAVLTEQRLRVLAATKHRPLSVAGIASVLQRDVRSVRRDVDKLLAVGILKSKVLSNPGHRKVKIVEPFAKEIELRVRL